MMPKKVLAVVFLFSVFVGFSQKKEINKATLITEAAYMRKVSSLLGKNLIPEQARAGGKEYRRTDGNKHVPGKGLPLGIDPLLVQQKRAQNLRTGKAPSLVFEVNSRVESPSDPTGAIGPNHYVSAKNSAFAIHDRNGVPIVPSTSLANIFPGETEGDPIVFYDNFADRFVITQFSSTPNGFLVAVSQGSDPVNDGWFTYRFNTGTFPDYTKFSIWSDGYYITANKDQFSQETSEVIYVIEREKMLAGEENVKMVGFPLPGAKIDNFYSPASFNATGKVLPPPGDAKIIYYQDDGWADVPVGGDELKLWTINVDWITPDNSTIEEAEELAVTPFDSTFDGGDFGNLPQPGTDGQDIDALQGAVMHATNYRRFCSYNSVVLNFVIDIDNRTDGSGGDIDNVAGIRWYELRQNGDGQPWEIYQEGTYTSPDGKSAWCASMAMDVFGNIGMGYTTMGTIADGASADSFASIRYTGRLATDPLGTMTIAEETIIIGTDVQRNNGKRYGDYAHLSIDPVDDATFWHIAEYFEVTGDNARDIVGVFKIAPDVTNDVGVVSIDNPLNKIFTATEEIEVTIQNFGTSTQSNIPVSYSINGDPAVNEVFPGPINAGEVMSFIFSTPADLTLDNTFVITAETNLTTDSMPENDCATIEVSGLLQNDVGVVGLVSPVTGSGISSNESITITIQNFGIAPQSNIPVFYTLDNEQAINEVFSGTIEPGESAAYTFNTTANLLEFQTYRFEIGTALASDENTENDVIRQEVEHRSCFPTSNCRLQNDGITSFILANISNTSIPCTTGYENFTNLIINLDGPIGLYSVTVQSGFARDAIEQMSLWIDFNDNGIFEDAERILSNEVIKEANKDQSFVFSLGSNATTGTHLLRIRAGDTQENSTEDLNDPCLSMQFGTTHDYTVNIGDNQPPILDLIVINRPNKQFLITMSDASAEDRLKLNVFTITGQIIVSNFVEKNANGRFVYELDMSYASTGIYFVRLGDKKNKNRSAKFAVQ